MADSNVVNENVSLKVGEQTKKGKEGSYVEKVVEFNGKKYVLGKADKDKVKVGETYDFKLVKSEFNDKLYYWANLVNQKKEEAPANTGTDEFKTKVFSYLKKLDREKQIATVKYILDNLN